MGPCGDWKCPRALIGISVARIGMNGPTDEVGQGLEGEWDISCSGGGNGSQTKAQEIAGECENRYCSQGSRRRCSCNIMLCYLNYPLSKPKALWTPGITRGMEKKNCGTLAISIASTIFVAIVFGRMEVLSIL